MRAATKPCPRASISFAMRPARSPPRDTSTVASVGSSAASCASTSSSGTHTLPGM
ncbi:MAG: hypothetical protein U0325_17070 [Polyangiales bacterium]